MAEKENCSPELEPKRKHPRLSLSTKRNKNRFAKPVNNEDLFEAAKG